MGRRMKAKQILVLTLLASALILGQAFAQQRGDYGRLGYGSRHDVGMVNAMVRYDLYDHLLGPGDCGTGLSHKVAYPNHEGRKGCRPRRFQGA